MLYIFPIYTLLKITSLSSTSSPKSSIKSVIIIWVLRIRYSGEQLEMDEAEMTEKEIAVGWGDERGRDSRDNQVEAGFDRSNGEESLLKPVLLARLLLPVPDLDTILPPLRCGCLLLLITNRSVSSSSTSRSITPEAPLSMSACSPRLKIKHEKNIKVN